MQEPCRERKKEGKIERKIDGGRENNLKESWGFDRAIEFNYLIETSKAFFSPLGWQKQLLPLFLKMKCHTLIYPAVINETEAQIQKE